MLRNAETRGSVLIRSANEKLNGIGLECFIWNSAAGSRSLELRNIGNHKAYSCSLLNREDKAYFYISKLGLHILKSGCFSESMAELYEVEKILNYCNSLQIEMPVEKGYFGR